MSENKSPEQLAADQYLIDCGINNSNSEKPVDLEIVRQAFLAGCKHSKQDLYAFGQFLLYNYFERQRLLPNFMVDCVWSSKKEAENNWQESDCTPLTTVDVVKRFLESDERNNYAHESSVCDLVNDKGGTARKILGTGLANKWKVKIVFSGTHKECIEYLTNNPQK